MVDFKIHGKGNSVKDSLTLFIFQDQFNLIGINFKTKIIKGKERVFQDMLSFPEFLIVFLLYFSIIWI